VRTSSIIPSRPTCLHALETYKRRVRRPSTSKMIITCRRKTFVLFLARGNSVRFTKSDRTNRDETVSQNNCRRPKRYPTFQLIVDRALRSGEKNTKTRENCEKSNFSTTYVFISTTHSTVENRQIASKNTNPNKTLTREYRKGESWRAYRTTTGPIFYGKRTNAYGLF